MYNTDPFYFQLIRKYVSLFGSLFANVRIIRTDDTGATNDLIRIPLTYAPKDKMLARVIEDPSISKQAAIQLPMMSFEIASFRYDSKRKLGNAGKVSSMGSTANIGKYQHNPVPWNLDFELFVYAKNAEDGTKIIEQIIPFFTPDFTVTAELIEEMNIVMDVPVILNDVSITDTFEGEFRDRRAIIWKLSFTVKGYLYGPITTSPLIKFAFTNVRTGNTISNNPEYTVMIQPGLTSDGQPTSNSAQSIPVASITANSDFGFIYTITESRF